MKPISRSGKVLAPVNDKFDFEDVTHSLERVFISSLAQRSNNPPTIGNETSDLVRMEGGLFVGCIIMKREGLWMLWTPILRQPGFRLQSGVCLHRCWFDGFGVGDKKRVQSSNFSVFPLSLLEESWLMKGLLWRAGVDIWIPLVRLGGVFSWGGSCVEGGWWPHCTALSSPPGCGISNGATSSSSSSPAREALWILIISF